MVGGLNQPDAGEFALGRAFHYRLHQLPPNGLILHRRVDRYRSDAGNLVTLVEKIAADDFAVQLRNDGIEARIGEQIRGHAIRDLIDGKSQGKLC